MAALKKHFPGVSVGELPAARLTQYFQRGKPCLKTYNNRRGLVSTFLRFAENQEWIATNPIKKSPTTDCPPSRVGQDAHRGAGAGIDDLRRRLPGGQLVPFFALCLFAGIRPVSAPAKFFG